MLARVLTRQHVRAVYQPIIHLGDGKVAGYEALARPANVADDDSVEGFFRTARQEGQIRDLDWLCRRAAIDGAKGLGDGPFLSLNLDPEVLHHAVADVTSLRELLEAAGRSPASVVVELMRPPSITSLTGLLVLAQPYWAAGLRIAVAGVEEQDEPMLLASPVQPDFIKLSRSAVAGIGKPTMRAFAERCQARAGAGGPVPVAEGIELPETAQVLMEIGFDLGQGYLLGRPAALDRDGRLLPSAGPDAA